MLLNFCNALGLAKWCRADLNWRASARDVDGVDILSGFIIYIVTYCNYVNNFNNKLNGAWVMPHQTTDCSFVRFYWCPYKMPPGQNASNKCVAGPTVWNSLPDSLLDPVIGGNSFRQSLKTFLFATYIIYWCIQCITGFTTMRCINRLFTYLLTYQSGGLVSLLFISVNFISKYIIFTLILCFVWTAKTLFLIFLFWNYLWWNYDFPIKADKKHRKPSDAWKMREWNMWSGQKCMGENARWGKIPRGDCAP